MGSVSSQGWRTGVKVAVEGAGLCLVGKVYFFRVRECEATPAPRGCPKPFVLRGSRAIRFVLRASLYLDKHQSYSTKLFRQKR